MPPWSNRLLAPSNTRNESHAHSNLQNPLADGTPPSNSRLRPSESDILEHAFGIPSLPHHPQSRHGSSATTRTSRAPSSHGRSMSHPFPSLFHGKKQSSKRHDGGEGTGVGGAAGFDSTTDDDLQSPVKGGNMGAGKSKEQVPDKDLRTGNCMTCDSMVRWPKELKVFRCSVCLTINDLSPIRLEARRGDGQRVPLVAGPGGMSPRVAPLSIERTRHIIDQCITTYLLARIKHEDAFPSGSDESLTRTPEMRPQDSSREPTRLPRAHTADFLAPPQGKPVGIPRKPVGSGVEANMARRRHPSHNGIEHQMYTQLSTSSPGDFGDHIEQAKRPQANQSYVPGGRTSEDRGNRSFDRERSDQVRDIFKPVEEYIIATFGSYECINTSFSSARPTLPTRAASEGSSNQILISPVKTTHRPSRTDAEMSEMDAKTLLLGDFAENGLWWTGEKPDDQQSPDRSRTQRGDVKRNTNDAVTLKSPRIDWADLNEWYYVITHASKGWRGKLDDYALKEYHNTENRLTNRELEEIDDHLSEAQNRVQRVLLKATETLLKRPSRPLSEPGDLRFLLILLGNPLLYPSHSTSKSNDRNRSSSRSREVKAPLRSMSGDASRRAPPSPLLGAPNAQAYVSSSGQHSGIIKRILGLLSNISNECHHHLVSWFARYTDSQFQRLADLIGSFVTYRLTRQHGKRREIEHDPTAGLIPSLGGRRGDSTSAALHAALGSGQSQATKKAEAKKKPVVYTDDWQIKAAARVMSLVVSANNSGIVRRGNSSHVNAAETHSAGLAARDRAQRYGRILATSDFYNTLLDYSDLIADFEAWESRKSKFAFCQYPFFLSIWAKIQIMEHDARRQMEVKAREAFFDSIMTRKNVNQYLVLKIRRECLVEDSLKGVSEVMGTGGEEIKKGLRIEFKGEEGIDAGGLRKEWFLLLVRDVFNPEHGMFTYDDDSQFCYFNPNSLETSDQFFLVGVVLGLAIYNSTILDVALPPFAFRKLLAAAPAATPGSASHAKPSMTYSLDDLAEYKPTLANGLRQLLDFEGDVESVYCRDFVADIERFGEVIQVPLCAGGEKRAVTNANRREFVDLYVRYLLDTAVIRQFEPFKRGFFSVCGGNALSLFRAEEIELLIRGSEEPLDIASLRVVSKNENWGVPNPGETEPVIQWFWESFQGANPKDQRKLLGFITGSDRIPAMGATNLVIKLSCLGDDSPRFPVARTCFNQISLWRYNSKEKLEKMLWWAVHESEGFGLK